MNQKIIAERFSLNFKIFFDFPITDRQFFFGFSNLIVLPPISRIYFKIMGQGLLYIVIYRFGCFTFMLFYAVEILYVLTVNLPVPPIKDIVYHDVV